MGDAPGPDLLVGRVLDDRYRLVARIGQGGLGFVYRGERVGLGRPLAVKMPYGESLHDRLLVRRFLREARTLAALDHPGIVALIDVGGSEASIPYVVMELLGGEGLDQRLARTGRLPAASAIRLVMQLADALGAAHRAGIVHRDLKPENVRLLRREGADETVKVLDFGFARLIDDAASADPEPLTRRGVLLGTPEYMAPELWRCEPIGPTADLYALGVVLYELCTGRLPFEADAPMGLMRLHVHAPPPPMAIDAPPPLADAIEAVAGRLLAKAPADRYATAAQLLEDLRELDVALVTLARRRPPADTDRSFVPPFDAEELTGTQAALVAPEETTSLDLDASPTRIRPSVPKVEATPVDVIPLVEEDLIAADDTERTPPPTPRTARRTRDSALLPAVVVALVTLGTLATFAFAAT